MAFRRLRVDTGTARVRVTPRFHVCSQCKQRKPSSAFYPDNRYVSGLDSRCKDCVRSHLTGWAGENVDRLRKAKRRCREKNRVRYNAYGRDAYRRHPERSANRTLVRKYGLTLQDKVRMVLAQEDKCAACGLHQPRIKLNEWHVDHDHVTKRVRAVLCKWCNIALGNAEESPQRLRALADYIERNTL